MNNNILEVKNLYKSYIDENSGLFRKKYKNNAVRDVSFTVKRGEIVGLIGESGCGKTTVGRIIAKLLKADSGSIIFDGVDITNLTARKFLPYRSKIQMIFQDPSTALNPQLKISKILKEALYSIGIRDEQKKNSIIDEYIEKVGLTKSYLSRYPHELSGGQKQRICILLALLTNPSLIIADEVVSALDLSVQAQILNLLRDLQQELKVSMIFISHDLSIVHYLSDKIIVMYKGEIVESGSCEEIYHNFKHPYTKLLLDSALTLKETDKHIHMKEVYNNIEINQNMCVFVKRCPYCKAICKQEKPKNILISDDHFVKCHFNDVINRKEQF